MSQSIPLKNFHYNLPPDRIASHPLPNRDNSKLLVYRNGEITHSQFKSIADFIPKNSRLFFNNTRVIPARIYFTKETGATIEVFLLNPIKPSELLVETMGAKKTCSWVCTIGNLKRWPEKTILTKTVNEITLTAELIDREKCIVDFTWNPDEESFAEIILKMGVAPLPPYIKRKADQVDKLRYQTIYAQHEGAVAAPTAGLHFTNEVLNSLKEKGVKSDYLTLHVSAGTFQPIKSDDALDHPMHSEQVIVSKSIIENLLEPDSFILPVGTTSMRTLESLYWYGAKLLNVPNSKFTINQDDPYVLSSDLPPLKQALEAVHQLMNKNKVNTLVGSTSIFIRPGYKFQVCHGLITNFHQPGSTLILLVAAFIGNNWRTVYSKALKNNYRFLSYGDSSLLIPESPD